MCVCVRERERERESLWIQRCLIVGCVVGRDCSYGVMRERERERERGCILGPPRQSLAVVARRAGTVDGMLAPRQGPSFCRHSSVARGRSSVRCLSGDNAVASQVAPYQEALQGGAATGLYHLGVGVGRGLMVRQKHQQCC